VCCAAQEAGAPQPWVSILAGRTIMQFLCIRNFMLLVRNCMIFAVEMTSSVSSYPTFQISTKSCQAFPRYKLSKIDLISFFFVFFFFLSKHEHKVEMGYLIPLKFRTKKGGVRTHLCTMFGHLQSYLRLFTKNNTHILSDPQGKPCVARS